MSAILLAAKAFTFLNISSSIKRAIDCNPKGRFAYDKAPYTTFTSPSVWIVAKGSKVKNRHAGAIVISWRRGRTHVFKRPASARSMPRVDPSSVSMQIQNCPPSYLSPASPSPCHCFPI
eukprot:Blabericola_migrator_1__4101@NODE_224_length_11141_cov_42_071880_g190_i0_p15_GENE_NODE_224_length_11141_cov_42_071880_g190_i0NODE_224_length_11141_cov_42_071880_g190_i0_p15_ORF_typecomplete_len119_score7_96Minor_tail_Z/PF06763_11/0_14_NODE_224_length_11141_cov_42_071880_g190_i025052861